MKTTKPTLHDIYGIPYNITTDKTNIKVSPPTVFYFEKLFRTYNIAVKDIEKRFESGDSVDARIEIIALVIKLLHIALVLGEPEEDWTLYRVADLIQGDAELVERFMESFKSYMPSGSSGTHGNAVKNPNPKPHSKV